MTESDAAQPWLHQATRLLQEAGTSSFGKALSQHALAQKQIDFVAINLHSSNYQLIERLGALSEQQQRVADTADRHDTFRFDPNSELVQRIRNPRTRVFASRVRFTDTRKKRYHDLFYERFDLVDRVSVITALGDYWLVSNFYRTRDSGPFSDSEEDDMLVFGEWVNSLAAVHLRSRLRLQLAAADNSQAKAGLALAFRELSPRELDVAARLVCGMGNAEAAQDLGIALETVRTLRRRLKQKSGCENPAALLRHALLRLG